MPRVEGDKAHVHNFTVEGIVVECAKLTGFPCLRCNFPWSIDLQADSKLVKPGAKGLDKCGVSSAKKVVVQPLHKQLHHLVAFDHDVYENDSMAVCRRVETVIKLTATTLAMLARKQV